MRFATYERNGIEGFGYGLVTLRRVSHRPQWWRHDEVPDVLRGRPAVGLRAGFESADWLLAHDSDEALLATRLQVDQGARIETWLRAEAGQWVPDQRLLRQTAGLPFSGEVSRDVAAFIACCDGSRTLKDALDYIQWPEPRPALAEVLTVVRALIANSFLGPAPD